MLERKWWTLIAVCTAIFMLLLDVTIVNVALPDIERSLGASFTDLQWVIDAYALTLATVVLSAGSLADLLGRKRIFVGGVALFTASSLLCGFATTPLFLILARGVQGVGGAIMFATSLALLTQEFHGRDRGTAFGIWGATTGAAVAVGPLIGGILTTGLGWRFIFFVNLPIGIATVGLSLARLAESRNPEGGRVDWGGLLTLSGSLFTFVLALLRGNAEGWSSPLIVGLFAVAAVLLAAFVVLERTQRQPMLELGLFLRPSFAGAQVAAFAISASIFAMFLYLTLYLQNDLGYSPLQAGLRFLPTTLLSFAVAPAAGKLSAHVAPRALIGTGLVLIALALLLDWVLVGPTSGWLGLLPGFVLGGIGVGLVNPPLASVAVGVVRPERSGMASGANSTFRQVGIATGIAGLGAIFQHHVAGAVSGALGGHAGAGTAQLIAAGQAAQAIRSAPPAARAHLAAVARNAFVTGLDELFLISAAVALVGAVATFVLVRRRDLVQVQRAAPEPA